MTEKTGVGRKYLRTYTSSQWMWLLKGNLTSFIPLDWQHSIQMIKFSSLAYPTSNNVCEMFFEVAFFAIRPHPLVWADLTLFTVFSPWFLPLVWADLTPFAFFAIRPHPLVWADLTPFTVFTPWSLPLVGADLTPFVVFALWSHPLVLTNSTSFAVFAPWYLTFMDAFAFLLALRAYLIWNSGFFVDVKFVLWVEFFTSSTDFFCHHILIIWKPTLSLEVVLSRTNSP